MRSRRPTSRKKASNSQYVASGIRAEHTQDICVHYVESFKEGLTSVFPLGGDNMSRIDPPLLGRILGRLGVGTIDSRILVCFDTLECSMWLHSMLIL